MTAEAFVRPQNVAVCLLLLIGYSGEKRDEWLRRAAQLSEVLPVFERLRVLAIITRMAVKDPDHTRMVVDHICALPTPESVHDGLVMATRLGVDRSALTEDQLRTLRSAASRRLRAAARGGAPSSCGPSPARAPPSSP
jgi:hypothetical protein